MKIRQRFAVITVGFAVLLNASIVAAEPELDVDVKRPGRMILHLCQADGTPIRPLVSDRKIRDQFDRQGTPDVSADGKRVVFDAWSTSKGVWQDARIIVVNLDGSDARNVSDGVMPSFSPDGKRLVVSRPNKHAKADGAVGMSIWVMNDDGTEKVMIADRGAWGARWSPDGKSLVFHGGLGADGKKVPKNCLRLYDFETKTTKELFTPAESPFSDLSYHFDWSPRPGKRLVAFGGTLKGGNATASAVVDADKGSDSLEIIVHMETEPQIGHGLSYDWHPTLDQILVTAIDGRRTIPKLLPMDYDEKTSEFGGLPENIGCRDPIFTVDGSKMIGSLVGLPTP